MDFTRSVSDCEELVGVTHRRSSIRFWKVVKSSTFLEAIYSNGVRYKFHALFKKVAQLHCIVRETMKLLEY